MEKFTVAYLNDSTISGIPALCPGDNELLSGLSLSLLTVLAGSASWCEDSRDVENMNLADITDTRDKFIKLYNVTKRRYSNSMRELKAKRMILKKCKNQYYINPFVFAKGSDDAQQKFRLFCVKNDLFYPAAYHNCIGIDEYKTNAINEVLSTKPLSEPHALMYLSLEDITKHIGFYAKMNSIKKINSTEFIIFSNICCKTTFSTYPNSPEKCGNIKFTVKKQRKLADHMRISDVTIRRSLNRLCQNHFLHKIEGENGEYIVNPYISAKGKPDRITALRYKLIEIDSPYFGGCADADYHLIGSYFVDFNGEIIDSSFVNRFIL